MLSPAQPPTRTAKDAFDQQVADLATTLSKHNQSLDSQAARMICEHFCTLINYIDDLEQIQKNTINRCKQEYEADHIDHMVKVQLELVEFRKKTEDYYQRIMENEKIQNLTRERDFFRTESVTLAKSVEKLTAELKQSQKVN